MRYYCCTHGRASAPRSGDASELQGVPRLLAKAEAIDGLPPTPAEEKDRASCQEVAGMKAEVTVRCELIPPPCYDQDVLAADAVLAPIRALPAFWHVIARHSAQG
jgi:hypothetical protein